MANFIQTITDIIAGLAEQPVLQGTLAAICTFVLEDPTVVSCGLLVAAGKMNVMAALIGLSLGITIGDLGLYVIGRFFGPRVVQWKWVTQERLDAAKAKAEKNLLLAVFVSRFLPGTRIPTFVAAGLLAASPVRFLAVALSASFVWTAVLLFLTVKIGEQILPLLGQFKWYALGIVILLVGLWAARKWGRKSGATEEKRHLAAEAAPVVSPFEFWHPVLFYFPVGLYYTWLAIRFRSISLPSLANPSIYSGGICRESKSEILALVPQEHRHSIAAYTTIQRNRCGRIPPEEVASATEKMAAAGLHYPVVAKPDMGQRGDGVRLVKNAAELARYLRRFPPQVPIILQQLADLPNEAGILYYRKPGESRGHIMSITLKDLPAVTGDGMHTIRQLILAQPRARLLAPLYFRKNKAQLNRVLGVGQIHPLVFAGNHCQGAVFRDGTSLATPAMTAAFARIADAMPEFYFGRFDLKFRDIESLRRGTDFIIVEINGASAESTHIWDARTKLADA